jgi:hypothetical protein
VAPDHGSKLISLALIGLYWSLVDRRSAAELLHALLIWWFCSKTKLAKHQQRRTRDLEALNCQDGPSLLLDEAVE